MIVSESPVVIVERFDLALGWIIGDPQPSFISPSIRRVLPEYVIVHEMVHLIEPTHSDRFLTILGEHYPTWREARAELNELPLAAEAWKE
jgi:Protein of unknown function DUF45